MLAQPILSPHTIGPLLPSDMRVLQLLELSIPLVIAPPLSAVSSNPGGAMSLSFVPHHLPLHFLSLSSSRRRFSSASWALLHSYVNFRVSMENLTYKTGLRRKKDPSTSLVTQVVVQTRNQSVEFVRTRLYSSLFI